MGSLKSFMDQLTYQFSLSNQELKEIAQSFGEEMAKGLGGQPSSLKMLPSYLANPTGKEKGSFLALDFGGTNVRILLVELLGEGKITVTKQKSFPLAGEGYNYMVSTAKELFDFLAQQITQFIDQDKTYYLGHTFSFPFRLEGVNKGILLNWTKEFDVSGVEGQDVMELLHHSLAQKGADNVILAAILNDTVGTQLTAAYQDPQCQIGSIIGTGHNTCYLEKGIIINMESGNFNKLSLTRYDQILNKDSEEPDSQWLEKMASGRYLGEIVRLIMKEMEEQGLLRESYPYHWTEKYSFSSAQMSQILSKKEENILTQVCALVRLRSIQLIAATYLGILEHLGNPVNIAIDGSLYEKMPDYAYLLQQTMQEIYPNPITIKLTKDGSGMGAAIAAALCQNK